MMNDQHDIRGGQTEEICCNAYDDESIPVDGTIIEGDTAVDESALTGGNHLVELK